MVVVWLRLTCLIPKGVKMTSDMSSRDVFFKQYHDKQNEAVNVTRTAAFEEVCVKKLLVKSGVTMQLAKWKGQQKRNEFSSRLTLNWMMDKWPRFPMHIAVGVGQYPGRLPYAALLGGKISKLTVFKDYNTTAENHDVDPVEDRFAMIFKCQRAKHATIQVLHNQPVQSDVADFDSPDIEGKHCRRFMFCFRGVYYVIEGIDSFVATIGTDWASDD